MAEPSSLDRATPYDAAYGARWVGVDLPDDLRASRTAPAVRWERDPGPGRPAAELPAAEAVGPERAALRAGSAWIVLRREPPAFVLRPPGTTPSSALVHPHLARAAAVVAAWWGREALQAGAVVGAPGAVAVAGPSGAGKSTLLAAAALAGRTVLADELAVIDGGAVLAGPTRAAVRVDAAELLGLPPGLRPAWEGRARLLPLGDAPAAVPLHGIVHLAWGSSAALEPLGPGARFAALGAIRLHGDLHRDGDGLLDLAARPAWRLVRPRTAAGHRFALEALDGLLD